MTLSPQTREEAVRQALTLLLQRVGDESFDVCPIFYSDAPFVQIPRTTWYELRDRGWVNPLRKTPHLGCTLSGSGWIQALEVTGRIDAHDFLDRLKRLTSTLKNVVKGRNADEYVKTRGVASAIGTSPQFVFNVIESRLIDHHFRIYGAEWSDRPHVIRVPLNFGMHPL